MRGKITPKTNLTATPQRGNRVALGEVVGEHLQKRRHLPLRVLDGEGGVEEVFDVPRLLLVGGGCGFGFFPPLALPFLLPPRPTIALASAVAPAVPVEVLRAGLAHLRQAQQGAPDWGGAFCCVRAPISPPIWPAVRTWRGVYSAGEIA